MLDARIETRIFAEGAIAEGGSLMKYALRD